MRYACLLAFFALQCDKPAEPPSTPAPAPEPTPAPAPAPEPEPSADPYALPDDAPDGSADCTTRRKFAIAFLDRVRTEAKKPCESDGDCVLVQDGSKCMGGCSVAVHRSQQSSFDGARQTVDEEVCATYRGDKCPYAGPRCANVEAKCNAGACEAAQVK